MEENNLTLPVEHIRDLIEKRENGYELALSEEEELNIRMYEKQLANIFDDDEDDDDNGLTEAEEARRKEILKRRLEEAKRKARTTDVAIIELTAEQKSQLRADMAGVMVRPDPNSVYNKTDDELYKNEADRVISAKLNRIRNCYYEASEWIAVVDVIKEAIEYELKSDKFAYMGSYENRLKAFNNGTIRLQIQMPKLYLNRISPETDPEVLRGIYNGEITVVDKNEIANQRHKSYKNSPVVSMNLPEIGSGEHDYYVNMHRKGFNTPLSAVIKAKSTIYDRYIDKTTSILDKPFGIVDKNGIPIQFDWINDSPQEYYRLIHGLKPNVEDIVNNVQKANGGKINKVLLESMNKMIHTDPSGMSTEKVEPNWLSSSLQVKPEVVKLEQDLLNSIQVNG